MNQQTIKQINNLSDIKEDLQFLYNDGFPKEDLKEYCNFIIDRLELEKN